MIRYAITVFLLAGTAFGQAPRPPVDQLSKLRDVTITNPTDNQLLKYDAGTSKWINATGGGGGATTFIELTDVPNSYSGQALKAVRVNAAANALEFYTPTAGGVTSFNTRTGAVTSQTGDYTAAQVTGSVPDTRTVNGHALSSNVTVTASDVSLGNVTNDAQTKAAIVPNTAPSAGQILTGNAGGTAYAPVTLSGSGATATLSSAGVLTLSAIPNATLSNSAITIAGTSTSLGGTITLDTITGLTGNGFVKRTSANTYTNDTSTYLTGNQSITLTGDVTGSGATAITTTLANIPTAIPAAGSIIFADIAAPSSPSAAHLAIFGDSTDLRFHDKNAAGTIGTTVVSDTGSSNNFLTAISASGVISKAQPSYSNLSGTDAPAIANVTGLGTGVGTFLATPSSANLRSALTDENGTGAALFDGATSPTFVTPVLGTPTSETATNLTGTANGLTAGDVTRNHAVYAGASPPTVDVGVFTIMVSGIDLKTAGTNDIFTVPTGRKFIALSGVYLVTSVTSAGAGVQATMQVIESGAGAAMLGTNVVSTQSHTPAVGNYYLLGDNHITNISTVAVSTACAAGNKVQEKHATSHAGSTAVTGSYFLTGFYSQ